MTDSTLLIINSGSSSVKFQLFSNTPELSLLARGKISNLGTKPLFSAINEKLRLQSPSKDLDPECNHEQAIHLILDWINQNQNWDIKAVAHRIVHGGELFTKSTLITPSILNQLKQFNSLAPLHQPHNLAAVEIIQQFHPELPQIACFDTAFHAHHSSLFTAYALPKSLRDRGVRRYGFHGLSFEWIAHRLKKDYPTLAKGRIITAHLGNGASLCAMQNGISIDTTMGLTALDGLPMGTRCGSLDPGAIIYMLRNLGLSLEEVEKILYDDSGLLGLSGLTNDVKELQNSEAPNAHFALDYFCLKGAQFIGMMAIALGGLDGIVFTGGIGENSELVRTNILNRIQCLQPFSVLVIPANEEKMMAMHTLALIGI
ncbi:acetate/propionate family kinase [Legionella maioricensis]|uniref:Acetate kinase n=1 Tax=Legionella maioricensis TaxID=2896528 RepID=A0A9X2IBR4_9GAMM|nr:acetate/propionate family kinase [Legionella maioricensis]MCL9684680.1 acetate/propionate family kinase [Legionella maioricensis]MCL9687708.1 acetate/propionate family kinase [Legionella maioricensis]